MELAARALVGVAPPFTLAPEAFVALVMGLALPKTPAEQPDEVDPARIIARCRENDRSALGELYRHYRNDALRCIRHAVRDPRDVDDILQEAFVEVARSIRSFEGRSSFESWLRSVCARTALRHMKRRARQVGESEQDVDERAERQLTSSDDPAEGYERRERARRIGRLLEQIAPKKRMVLILHDFEGISPKEISTMVGAPVLTVRTRLFYARKELAGLASKDPMLASDLGPWLEAKREVEP
jgi:RNA polymerase sigma-70 factor, ECF subfamily